MLENISNICSIVELIISITSLIISIVATTQVIKISKTINIGNKDDHSKTVNKNKGTTFNGDYTGRDRINGN